MPKGGIRGANQPNVTRLSTNTTYRHGSSLPSIEQAMQLRLPMASHPRATHRRVRSKRPQPVIVAKLDIAKSSSDFGS